MLLIQHLGPGGSERQLFEIATNLDRGLFTPHVGCFRTDGVMDRRLRERGIPVLQLSIQSFASVSALSSTWRLARYFRRHGIRVVHAFDMPMACFGVPVARIARVPVVLSSQRGHRDAFPQRFRKLLRISDRLAHGVVVNCDFMARHLREEGVPADRIRICRNGVDALVFVRREPPRSGKAVIGTVSVLRPEKGLTTLIEAFARVRGQRPDAQLIITGSGSELEGLKARARSLSIDLACHFEPATDDVPRALAALDIFVLPSLSEALSNSAMEAMAAGLCVIASRAGGNPELIADGETGLLFEIGDAEGLSNQILRVLADEALREKLGQAGARRMRDEFASADSVGKMQEIYTNYLGRRMM
jgi:glycosyltransferase involved in cell wall biosynthesis